ncbi:MAG: glycoside hydrolase family 16 protein [Rhodothermia bacterium]|nr:glycoside hydrolase family 16 protein [Rhodothermia bacterium]
MRHSMGFLSRAMGIFALAFAVIGLASCSSTDNPVEPDVDTPDGFTLVWNDEFDGNALDLSKWEAQTGDGCPNLCGWGNNELQFYRSQNATVANGFLTITAQEQVAGGRDYTSARLRTKDKGDWLYGRIEVRAKLPAGQGMWPAIWMLPTDNEYGGWAASGEIDIMEARGQEPRTVHGTLHYGASFPRNTSSGTSKRLDGGESFTDEFHEFAIEWDEGRIRWYVDGVSYQTQTQWFTEGHDFPAPFDKRFHLLLNVAVGGNFVGSPDQTTSFPQVMVVDYVRVFERE